MTVLAMIPDRVAREGAGEGVSGFLDFGGYVVDA